MTTSDPTTKRGIESYQRIVESAADLFYRRGVSATGLNDVIAASGTGKSQIYHYFDDKGDLAVAVIRMQTERTLAAQTNLFTEMSDIEDLEEWTRLAVEQHVGGTGVRCPLGALSIELAGADERARAALVEGFGLWQDLIASGLRPLQHSGAVRDDKPPLELAEYLLVAYEGGVLLSGLGGAPEPLRRALALAVDVLKPVRSATMSGHNQHP